AAADEAIAPRDYDDAPLLSQPLPEGRAFVEAYNRVGRPRIAIFVSRIVQAGPASGDAGAADPLARGAADLAEVDQQAVETVLADWIACDGQVSVLSPMMIRQKLTDQQFADLERGRPGAVAEIAHQLGADVLVQTQARVLRSPAPDAPPEVRIIAEAINVREGDSIARALADVPAPLDKGRLDGVARHLVRKLMNGMTTAWSTAPVTPREGVAPATAPGR
ncbi:MAG: hypothetical protein WBD40_02120, partial [Tepidisphaeraceae bacterium]